jgi:pimeloyl-ACP methyl ester carboxylesterase
MTTPGLTVFHSDPKNRAAIVFVHGFTGDLRKTWRNIPDLITKNGGLNDWDMLGFGYVSTKWFDITGLWSADADLAAIAIMLYGRPELSKYKSLAFVAHSMGGLVVQDAIVSHSDLRDRVSQVVFFGTPSNGLVKAGFADFWKRQVKNMDANGTFIKSLRKAWDDQKLSGGKPFRLIAVAGERDQFVPPESSLGCFPNEVCRVIPGNHLTMLEGDTVDAPAVQIILQAMKGDARPAGARSTAHVAIEKGEFLDIIKKLWPEYLKDRNAPYPALDDYGAGQLAMALDKNGDPETAIKLLSARKPSGTDVLGILAGRYKRRWWQQSLQDDLDRALLLYTEGYEGASTKTPVDHDQAYYHGINIAYLKLAPPAKDISNAKEWAGKVLEHTKNSIDPQMKKWTPATEADALLILGETDEGLTRHKQAAAQILDPWEALSMEEQTMRIADLCGIPDDRIKELGSWYEDRL